MIDHVYWKKGALTVLDQRLLPFKKVYKRCETLKDVVNAIKDMTIRGAPLIGIVAGRVGTAWFVVTALTFFTGIQVFILNNQVTEPQNIVERSFKVVGNYRQEFVFCGIEFHQPGFHFFPLGDVVSYA